MRFLIFFLLSINVVVFAQDTKFILNKGNDYSEEYYVLANDESVRHGSYVKYKTPHTGVDVFDKSLQHQIQLLETGSYTNGERTGVWEKYHNTNYNIFKPNRHNSLKERGLYVGGKKNGLWVQYYLDTISDNNVDIQRFGLTKTDSINLKVKHANLKPCLFGRYINDKRVSEWTSLDRNGKIIQKYNFKQSLLVKDISISDSVNLNYNRPPLFIGGLLDLYVVSEINNSLILPSLTNSKSMVTIEFVIDTLGYIRNPMIFKSTGSKEMEREILRIFSSTFDNWIPARRNGQLINYKNQIQLGFVRGDTEKFWAFKFEFVFGEPFNN